MTASDRLVAALRSHALIIGKVTLTSGKEADYYVDAKRAILLPEGFAALAELVAGHARDLCREEVPRLSEYGGGHVAACHFPLNVTPGEVAGSTKSPLSPLDSGDTPPVRVEDESAPLTVGALPG